MKVFVVFIFAIGCVSARGSGPYLPSGWKPDGPAFYLPSEVAKPADTLIEEPQFQETEASGSDAFKEYGPPKLEEVSLGNNQVLPEFAIEQAFLAEDKSESIVAAVEETANIDANTQQVSDNTQEESTTESQKVDIIEAVEDQVTESSRKQETAGAESLNLVEHLVESSNSTQSEEGILQEEVVQTTIAVVEEKIIVPAVTAEDIIIPAKVEEGIVVPLAQQELVHDPLPTAAAEEQVVLLGNEPDQITISSGALEETDSTNTLAEQNLPQDVTSTPVLESIEANEAEGVNRIIENEIKASEVASIGDSSSTQETSGALEQVPEGFLDYSPLGFAVYGPPIQEDPARLTTTEIQKPLNARLKNSSRE